MRETLKIGCLLIADPEEYSIKVDEKVYQFEWHYYCGPTWLNEDGQPRSLQPKKFIRAAELWDKQGREIDADGFCVWKIPDPFEGQDVVMIGKRTCLVIPKGRDRDEYLNETFGADLVKRAKSFGLMRPHGRELTGEEITKEDINTAQYLDEVEKRNAG
jgi:hypothetical protein